MAKTQSRTSGLFSGLVLISVGALILAHNYGRLDMGDFFRRWWPLLIVFWGVVKLYERTVGRRFGGDGGAITAGEVLLVILMLGLVGTVATIDIVRNKVGNSGLSVDLGDNYSFDDVDVTPQTIPAGARVMVRVGRGDVTVRASDDQEVRVTAKKGARTWSEEEAKRLTDHVKVAIVKNGDGYEIQPSGYDLGDTRIGVDLEIEAPKNSPVTVRSDKGDVSVSDIEADVQATLANGDAEVRNTKGDVSIEMKKGDVKVSATKGNVKVSGRGGEVEAVDTTGSFTVDGDFYGPIRADKSAKGVRLISAKSDVTISALDGHLEAGSGNLDLVNAPGNVSVRTRDAEVNIENAGGKVQIDNRNGQVNARYSTAPKDDISITNSSSGISLTVPSSSSFDIEADCRNCDISSEFANLQVTKAPSGDSHLAGKNGSMRGPKITLKTSYGGIELRRTTVTMPGKPAMPPAPPEPPDVQEH